MPLAEVCCPVSENFHIAWTNKTGGLDVEVTPAYGGVEVHGAAVLPAPPSLGGWPGFKRNGRGAVIPDARFGDNIDVPTQRSGS